MRDRYPGLQNGMLDREDADHNVIPGKETSWVMSMNLSEGITGQCKPRNRGIT
jgi:hypothetical protein